MAIDAARRQLLGAALLGLLTPWRANATSAATPTTTRWVAAWSQGDRFHIGLLRRDGSSWRVEDTLPVPTRAHGLQVLPDGSVIAVARRPGDWLLRWQPLAARRPAAVTTRWAEPQRQFNGHAVLHPDGRHLLVTESDTETDSASTDSSTGRVVLRELASLAVVAEWPTLGHDPHQLLLSPDGRQLWVANGGIASRPETGRARLAEVPMNASLVALDAASGAVRGRWQLDDARLSLRHLAWHAASATLGVAMQAEHPDAPARDRAPVLALIEPFKPGAALRCVDAPVPMAGYGGDICATAIGFAVSGPRSGRVACWHADGRWQGATDLALACALAPGPGADESVAAGQGASTTVRPGATVATAIQPLPVTPDNHWVRWR